MSKLFRGSNLLLILFSRVVNSMYTNLVTLYRCCMVIENAERFKGSDTHIVQALGILLSPF